MRLAKSSPNKAPKAMNPADTGMLTGAVPMAIAAPRGAATLATTGRTSLAESASTFWYASAVVLMSVSFWIADG